MAVGINEVWLGSEVMTVASGSQPQIRGTSANMLRPRARDRLASTPEPASHWAYLSSPCQAGIPILSKAVPKAILYPP